MEADKISHNSYMRMSRSEQVYCLFCKLPHRIYKKKDLGVLDGIFMMVIAGILSLAIWNGPELRSLAILMVLVFVAQVLLRVRYRQSVKCPHCAFDPIVYKKSPDLAAEQVKAFLAERKQDPRYLLKPQPKIPVIRLKPEELKLVRENQESLKLGEGEPTRSTPLIGP